MYMYMYVYMCACVCVLKSSLNYHPRGLYEGTELVEITEA